ncbi:MAG: hypothetical protein AAGD43_35395 [Pseudomonadota bacterium]
MSNAPSIFDKIKYGFGILGTFVGGAVIIYGPGTMPQEIPYHVEIGWGFIAFGGLMILALINVRAKALMLTLVTGFFSTGAVFAGLYADLPTVQAAVIGILGALGWVYVLFCFASIFTGKDPA